jgi:hypothetical protein
VTASSVRRHCMRHLIGPETLHFFNTLRSVAAASAKATPTCQAVQAWPVSIGGRHADSLPSHQARRSLCRADGTNRCGWMQSAIAF